MQLNRHPLYRCQASRAMTNKRPTLLTIIAGLLAYLGVGAVILAVMAPRLAELGLEWKWIRGGAFLYGLTALPAAYGLWHRTSWAVLAYKVWVVAATLASLTPSLAGASTTPFWVVGAGALVLGAALWGIGRPIHQRVTAAV
jgi:hypothetical protein